MVCQKFLLYFIFTFLPSLVFYISTFNCYYDFLWTKLFPIHHENDIFDFIIVGAGSAGAVLANRLSKHNKVLVLEVGSDPLYLNSIPGLAPVLLDSSEVNWKYETIPQKNVGALTKNKVSKWPSGKLVGGSSNLNYLEYVRGHPFDYDNWANLTGDPSWRYENLLPFFKASLNYHGNFTNNEKHYEKTAYGKLQVEARPWSELYQTFIDAGQEIGYSVKDLNGPQSSGFGSFEFTQKDGKRHSTYTAFIHDIVGRQNLYISKYSRAIKIQLDKSNKAIGIWYIHHGIIKKYAKVSKEIIICAGAIESPKLLMLSGIGPSAHLQSVGIKPIVDLPVGKNLMNHALVMMPNFIIDKPISFMPQRDFTFKALLDYFLYGKGPLVCPTKATAQAFISSSVAKFQHGFDWPDLQIYLYGVGMHETIHQDLSNEVGFNEEILERFTRTTRGHDGFILASSLGRTKTTGEILLKDKNPLNSPIIDPHYLEHPDDIKILVEGMQFALNLVENTESFKKLNARLADVPFEFCNHLQFKSDEYFKCYVKYWAMTCYHPAGSCRMGSGISDPKAVVDSKLRVLKTKGLRVADNSLMPVIVNGNTNAPAILIGEKAAYIIREYWSTQYLICLNIFYNDWFSSVKNIKCYYSRLV